MPCRTLHKEGRKINGDYCIVTVHCMVETEIAEGPVSVCAYSPRSCKECKLELTNEQYLQALRQHGHKGTDIYTNVDATILEKVIDDLDLSSRMLTHPPAPRPEPITAQGPSQKQKQQRRARKQKQKKAAKKMASSPPEVLVETGKLDSDTEELPPPPPYTLGEGGYDGENEIDSSSGDDETLPLPPAYTEAEEGLCSCTEKPLLNAPVDFRKGYKLDGHYCIVSVRYSPALGRISVRADETGCSAFHTYEYSMEDAIVIAALSILPLDGSSGEKAPRASLGAHSLEAIANFVVAEELQPALNIRHAAGSRYVCV